MNFSTEPAYLGEPTSKKIQNYIFKFADLLGQGNFSKVYKGHHEITNELVAIKIVELNSLKSKKLEQLLFSQIDVLKKLNHPNVLKCFEVFTSNRNCYIITELCNEGDLESKLKPKGLFTEIQAETYIKDIFEGLLYLSEKNVIHRDLKTANIFIHNGRAKIADFGFAKFTKIKFKDINIGSPIYMSPEGLIDNVYGPKTDVWSFGILIYELLHGETPFSHCKTQKQLKYNMSITIGWSQLKPDLSNQVKQLIIKCLEIDQNKRISMPEIKKISYFRKMVDFQTFKNKVSTGGSMWATQEFNKFKSPLYNDVMQNIYRSENQIFVQGKQRIKTEAPYACTLKPANVLQAEKPQEFRLKAFTPGRINSTKLQNDSKTSFSYNQGSLHERKFSTEKYVNDFNSLQRDKSPIKQKFTSLSFNNLNKAEKSSESGRGSIISASLTFKASVNILHYCRLIYKHILLAKEAEIGDDNQIGILKRWLAITLKAVIKAVEDKNVVYEGENAFSREKKLQEVAGEYEKKYNKELNLQIEKIKTEDSSITNYPYMYNYFYSIFQMVDAKINKDNTNGSLLILGHSIIMICESTKLLKKCYDDKNYQPFDHYKEIQNFLVMAKDVMDLPSYLWHRRRFQL